MSATVGPRSVPDDRGPRKPTHPLAARERPLVALQNPRIPC
ncbi:hypothetical protein ACFPM0_19155 [Pseudonocardia sulfidoxydans]